MPFPGSARRRMRAIAVIAAAIAVGAVFTGCSPQASSDGTIALLLPDAKTARYETFDRPLFEKRVGELGDYTVTYSNAAQDASAQKQQAESALSAGADVLVLDPVDSKAAASIVNEAKAQGVPVIAYDRFISGGGLAYYVSFDNQKVGQLQAAGLVEGLRAAGKRTGGILIINGSPTDSNAALFSKGAHSVLDRSGLSVLAEYDTPGWSPDKAQDWVTSQIAQYGDRIAGVYAANDGVAGGAVAAFKAAGMQMPIVTGQDAELTAVQRIVAGDQFMTVYKAIKPEAYAAAEAAVDLITGKKITAPLSIDGTPSLLLNPVSVKVGDIQSTIIADGFWTAADICTAAYAQACAEAGIK